MIWKEEIFAAFCRLMARGWVAGAEEVELPELPGFKCIRLTDGDWHLLDAYCVPNGNWSWGVTTLSYKGAVVLNMTYWGMYEEDALQPLKDVLREAYEQGEFWSGRGRPTHWMGDFRYDNHEDPYNGGFNFGGHEEIHRLPTEGGGNAMGSHDYAVMIFPS